MAGNYTETYAYVSKVVYKTQTIIRNVYYQKAIWARAGKYREHPRVRGEWKCTS